MCSFPTTTAQRVKLITFYIDNQIAGNPRLMRMSSESAYSPQVMVEGIENVQFSFDLYNYTNSIDTSNVATTDPCPIPGVVTPCPNQIRSVRVALYGHSPDRLKRTGDYYHFGLVSKINVRNATFRNRYQ